MFILPSNSELIILVVTLEQWLSAGDSFASWGTLDNVWGHFFVVTTQGRLLASRG